MEAVYPVVLVSFVATNVYPVAAKQHQIVHGIAFRLDFLGAVNNDTPCAAEVFASEDAFGFLVVVAACPFAGDYV